MRIDFYRSKELNVSIDYTAIRKKKNELDEKIREHSQKIRGVVRELLSSYHSSLELPDSSWLDLQGARHPYTSIFQGESGENAVLAEVSPYTMGLNQYYKAEFYLDTVVDDSPRGGAAIRQRLAVYEIDGQIKVKVSDSSTGTSSASRSFIVNPGKAESFFEVCEYLKDNVLMGICDKNLNRETDKSPY